MKFTLNFLCQIFLLVILSATVFGQKTENWGAQKDGTFYNPVIPSDYSDLDAIRVGDDFYAISSTMQFSPGMVVLHSKDLVNWEIAGHVVADLTRISPNLDWTKMNSYGRGIWAGSIRYYKNKFWVYFGSPDDGFFMSSATDAKGPWEPLHQVWNVSGWDDCSSFYDDDGQLYFIATNFKLDPKTNKKYNIHLFKMAQDGKSLRMDTDTIIHQSSGSEANKLYKINGLYYHFFSEVKAEGRVVMMERSRNITGPWEIKQLNHVNKNTDKEPNQGGIMQLKNGQWWFLTHHGSGDWEGRPASLLPVTWVNGWPIIGKVGEDNIGNMVWSGKAPIPLNPNAKIQTDDDFSSVALRPQWEWNYQPRTDKWSLSERKGFLRLKAFQPIKPDDPKKILLRAGNTITQRSMRTRANEATVKLDISGMADGQFAGLTHFSTTSLSMVGIKQQGDERLMVYHADGQELPGIKIKENMVWLRSTWDYQGQNRYFYSLDGKNFLPIGNVSQLTWGSYRGDRIGIFNYNKLAEKGFVDIDYFNYKYSK